ncbi:FHA domain-containing protein [Nonomuraea typhae]|uniref:FHA domain-containing protein n=1 Tax=Nonomuraea typhae TaxID=2603600 RepID=UPI0012FCF8BF|nr:FHA domain-containing protein [Nonomuraea typhae]
MRCPLNCPDPGPTTMCRRCGSDLVTGPGPGEQAPPCVLVVRFAFGDVTPCTSAPVRLGRDPAWSPFGAALAAHGNVSRKHATLGLDADGQAWIDPEPTPNGTFLNGAELPPGTRHPLSEGDTVRLAAGPEGVVTQQA